MPVGDSRDTDSKTKEDITCSMSNGKPVKG